MEKEEIKSFTEFAYKMCDNCNCWAYCPDFCKVLEKAQEIPFDKLAKKYTQHEGDLRKVTRWIKNYKLGGEK